MNIPKLLHHIWVGPKPPPEKWMRTWWEKHPGWKYRLWGNHELLTHPWKNKRHMLEFARRGQWAGVADLMRYEILLAHGGVVLAADSECLSPIDDLFADGAEIYAINTGEYEGGPRVEANLGATTPLYAAVPGHWFTAALVRKLSRVTELRTPVRTCGNRFMQRMIRRHAPPLKVWPMHYFIPEHFNGWRYTGPDKVYARHFWGTTRDTYALGQ